LHLKTGGEIRPSRGDGNSTQYDDDDDDDDGGLDGGLVAPPVQDLHQV